MAESAAPTPSPDAGPGAAAPAGPDDRVDPPQQARTVLPASPAGASLQAPGAAAAGGCLNCGQPWPPAGPIPRYCSACGQDSRQRVPTLREYWQQFTGSVFSSEGALWRTLALLLFRPGALTQAYLAGRRRHYVLPVRLFLSISLVTLVALRLLASEPEVDGLSGSPMQDFNIVAINDVRAGLKDGRFFCENLPEALCRRLQRRLDHDTRGLRAEVAYAADRFVNHWGTAMLVLVPLMAGWLKLAYLGSGLRYAEHLAFALHVHSFWFAAMWLTLPGLGWLNALAALAIPVYTLLAARRVYGRGWPGTLARAVLVSIGYGLTLSLAATVVLLTTLLG